ncbi:6-phosphofructokinase / inosine-guanosine kinase / cytidine kinase [Staphylothermus marinus F1]|uniref:6-phosphofructokinase / inosine-guanosine kinase / cytidine kinase n=1 Tax=Staphylothermus marinus (strain ATCC 43588 / DSM 3639 / JCM 9404 / F1) TaxID=399550 RepID=A3DKG1_STAMF|nr:6-phosphofructokinase / inosine-guanosine kinase / cytidine kinase [Staphylothermus marinus F1]
MNVEKYDVVAVGHGLVDIRFIVDRFVGPDEEASIIKQTRGVGGSAANVSIDVSRLGGRSAVIVKVGLDGFGRLVIDELMREKVDVSGVKVCLGDTGFTVVIIDRDGKIIMYGYKGSAEKLEPKDLDEGIISRGKYLHIASLRLDTSLEAAKLAKKHGLKTAWDPGRRLSLKGLSYFDELLKYIDIVLVNKKEAYHLTGISDYREAAKKILETGVWLVVIKRGPEGIYAVTSDGETYDLPAFPVDKVIDTTGAGDAFASGLLLGLSRGYNLKKALIYGNAVAALKTSRLGSHNVPSHEEVIKYIWEHGLS